MEGILQINNISAQKCFASSEIKWKSVKAHSLSHTQHVRSGCYNYKTGMAFIYFELYFIKLL